MCVIIYDILISFLLKGCNKPSKNVQFLERFTVPSCIITYIVVHVQSSLRPCCGIFERNHIRIQDIKACMMCLRMLQEVHLTKVQKVNGALRFLNTRYTCYTH